MDKKQQPGNFPFFMSSFQKRLNKRLEDPAFEKEWAGSEATYLEMREQIQKQLEKEAVENGSAPLDEGE